MQPVCNGLRMRPVRCRRGGGLGAWLRRAGQHDSASVNGSWRAVCASPLGLAVTACALQQKAAHV